MISSRSRLVVVVLAVLLVALPAAAKKREVKDYSKTIKEFKEISVVAASLKNCAGYAVFPSIGKGGLGIGASHGKGQVYKGGQVIGFTSTSDVSIGFQAGGQAYSQIVFFENESALTKFTSGNFEFSASAEAIAVQAKAEASAGTEGTGATASSKKTGEKAAVGANYQDGVAVFTMAKGGLMYAATIAGQKYGYKPVGADDDDDDEKEEGK